MRMTLPATMPLRVSTATSWPFDDVSGLRLRHLQLGHQHVGPRYARDVRAGLDLRAFFDQHRLHDAGEAGAHVQRFDLLAHAFVRVLILTRAARVARRSAPRP